MSSKKLKKLKPPHIKNQEHHSECNVSRDSVYFSFCYITDKRKFNLSYFDSQNSNASKKLIKTIETISQFTWTDLGKKGRKNGGFEMLPLSSLNADITDRLEESLKENTSSDTKLHVFRFGDYRLVGLKTGHCRATLHILGFDWDFSLYDHGS